MVKKDIGYLELKTGVSLVLAGIRCRRGFNTCSLIIKKHGTK
jgi:hypothetical protein